MIIPRVQGIATVLLYAKAVLVLALYWGLLWVFASLTPGTFLWDPHRYMSYSLVVVLAMVVHYGFRDKSKFDFLSSSWIVNMQSTFQQCIYVASFFFTFLVLTKDTVISRTFLIAFLAVLYPLILCSDRYLFCLLAGGLLQGKREHRTLLMGSLDRARQIRKWLEEKKILGLEVVGILTDDAKANEWVDGFYVLGGTGEMDRIIEEQKITQLFLLEVPLFPGVMNHMAFVGNRFGLRLLILNDLDEKFGHSMVMEYCDGVKLITLRTEPLENPLNRLIKRTMDICIALPVVMFVLPPLSLVVFLLQRVQSSGPVLFRQVRAGLGNKEFRIFKYRTMHVNHGREAQQATVNDDRIFPAGRWMRRFSIDEFPQFLNVLIGDMSVVGPRPHLLEHNKEFEKELEHYNVRSFVKPGIAGLAQVRGYRGETINPEDLHQRIESDIYYIENWTLSLDILIVFRTFGQLIRPSSRAY